MIAGRTRFHIIAGITGALVGEIMAGAILLAAAHFAPLKAPLLLPVFLSAGVAGGAWFGVALMRRWYRRHAGHEMPGEATR